MGKKRESSGEAQRKAKSREGKYNVHAFIGLDVGEALEAFLLDQRLRTSKTGTIELSLQEFLKSEGYYPRPKPGEPKPPAPRMVAVGAQQPRIPFVGTISAGTPTEIFEQVDEWVDFSAILGGDGRYAFRVKGDSMTEAGILPGDFVVIRRQPEAKSGEDVIASYDGQLVLKRLIRRTREMILVSCDGRESQYRMDDRRGDEVIGALVAVVRKK